MRIAQKLIFTVLPCFANVYSSDNSNNQLYSRLPPCHIDTALESTKEPINDAVSSCLSIDSITDINNQLHDALYHQQFDEALKLIDKMDEILLISTPSSAKTYQKSHKQNSFLLSLMRSFNKSSFNDDPSIEDMNYFAETENHNPPFNEEQISKIYHIIEQLIQKGDNIEAKTVSLKTPLMCAAYFTNLEIVKLLVQHGANVNAQDSSGYCPLYLAIANRKFDVASYLINKVPKIDLKLKNAHNHSIMHIAIQKENISIIKALMKHKSFPTQKEWEKMRRHFSIEAIKSNFLTNKIKKKLPTSDSAVIESMMTAWEEQDDSSISNIFSPLTLQIPRSTHTSPSHSNTSSPQKIFIESESRKEATRYSFYKVRSPEEEDYLKEYFLDDDFDLERSDS